MCITLTSVHGFFVSKLTLLIELRFIMCGLKSSHHSLRSKPIFGIPVKDMLKNVAAPLNLKVKIKVTLVQALRLCTGRTAHRWSRGIVLLFHDHGTRRG